MMRLGVDLVAVDELDRLIERAWFVRYFFADVEMAHADTLSGTRRREFLAGRFAAKEAVLKVLGVGIFDSVVPRDIVVERGSSGAPTVTLADSAALAAQRVEIEQVNVSISHKRELVAAVAAGW
ncbi:holo-[acyl-carrier protein] synthase [Allocatelliglobosispora scoriae]|uniref:Holo-[acyl-carrier protein] synthase n=1 Tax=Allocatelliglobosispora scoriae TaxID=643052 RepID=A0A841C4V6_9ACTN|nr:holo-ACP synthase [Allocatelliglobosispora scoriae]MBB5874102.1 holo-[acyl-carrier protein] synthase [Allocatelliglobosispora scoriae]